MSRRQAQIIKHLRAELESERKLLHAYQLLYGKTPQERQPVQLVIGSSSTVASRLAGMVLQENLDRGQTIEIPSLGITFSKKG